MSPSDRNRRPFRHSLHLVALLVGALSMVLASTAVASPPGKTSERPAHVNTPRGMVDSRPGVATVTGSYIVVLNEGAPGAVSVEHARRHGVAVDRVYEHAVRGYAARMPERAARAIARDPRVAWVEPETIEELATDDAQTVPTGIQRIRADQNRTISTEGDSDSPQVPIDIAVIDSGITPHEDLNVVDGRNFVGGNPNNWQDGNGHGTHVAGTIGALDNGFGVVGVAPGAKLHSLKVCPNQTCNGSAILGAIDWMTEQKVKSRIDFAAANFSITTGDSTTPCNEAGQGVNATHTAICGAVDAGIVFVIAAGNNNVLKNPYPETLAVSAVADFDGEPGGDASPTCRNETDDTLADFSNYGPNIDIAAPGVCILSTWNDGGYNTISGTSMAAPHVTGAVALHLHGTKAAATAKNATEAHEIKQAIIGEAEPQGESPCSYAGPSDDDPRVGGPLLAVDGENFGGTGTCPLAVAEMDLAVSKVDAGGSAVVGEDVTVSVTLQNVGTEAINNEKATVTVVTFLDSDGGSTPGPTSTLPDVNLDIQPGDTKLVTLELKTGGEDVVAGSYTLEASHNFDDDVTDNNTKTTTLVLEDPLMDLAVSKVDAGGSAVVGDDVTVSVTLENVGNQDINETAAMVTVETVLDGVSVPVVDEEVSVNLSAGASETFDLVWDTTNVVAGTYTLTASHNVTDDFDGNDTKTTTLVLAEESDVSIKLDGDYVNLGREWTSTVTVTITDAEGNPTSDAGVTFEWESERGETSDGDSPPSCTTETNGTCTIDGPTLPKRDGSVTFTVLSVDDVEPDAKPSITIS